jgi:hypothetical protein
MGRTEDRSVATDDHRRSTHDDIRWFRLWNSFEDNYILTFIQVGRAITHINPGYDARLRDPIFEINNDATVATALTNVFGP